MDFSPTSTAHRRLAHLARQRFVEGLCAGLPALDKTVHDFLTELMGQTATQRDMQLRRDAWMGHQAHRKTWVEHLGRAWRESLAPPPVTGRGTLNASKAFDGLELLGDDVLENGQNVRINIDDGSGACIYDFKAEFTNGEELTRSRINVCEIGEYSYTR